MRLGLRYRRVATLVVSLAALGPAWSPAAAQTGGAADTVDPVAVMAAEGRLQEAAWLARERGEPERADALLKRLESILRARPVTARPLSMDSQGVSYTFRLDHGGGVHSIFKVDGSDIFCPSCGMEREVAAYRIDRLLGFDLTPMTVFQTIVVDGDTLTGSAMYFVSGASSPVDVGAAKSDRLRLLDAIIGNSDRHDANWLVLGGRIVAIDHNRAFEYRPTTRPKTCWETEIDAIEAPARLGRPFRRLRALPPDSLVGAVEGVLEPEAVRAFVDMRDRVVARVEARIEDPETPLPRTDCPW